MADTPRIDILRGAQILPWIGELAALRITVFREWPYLYAGDADYEAEYMQTYARSPAAALVLARAGQQVIGASTALPLSDETANVQAPFIAAGIEVSTLCYFGESVLLPQWRGHGLGHRFFDAREAHARSLPGISHCAFCAVDRADDDARRPSGARSLHAFWTARGYVCQPQLRAHMDWLEVDQQQPSSHSLSFWIRPL